MEYAQIWDFKSCLCGVESGGRRCQEQVGGPERDGEKQQSRESGDVEWIGLGV